ncbi:uncharacterized protein BXZ73DRAFT_88432 [Epithele typhae]|uniref:uncharacterized protein n=1 Tax=Epithele typhae TaxID=378194 RepID=UPI0020080D33|nr:uncharacterized protein BXZ73DRAFT_88432 [Epithele typhae]KAH9941289.1 hypothetical protein BXZ73DRAFT_88432 [Epithele typhae]
MENVPPAMGSDTFFLDDAGLRPKHNAKASRQKRSPALNLRTNADREDEDSPNESGLLTPPSSQTQEDMDPVRMLFSPPPEDILRDVHRSASRAQSVPTQPFSPSPADFSTGGSSKRKRNAHNRSASHTALESIFNEPPGSLVVNEATPNPRPRKQTNHGSSRRSANPPEEPGTPTRASHGRSESPSKRVLLLSPHCSNPSADYIPPLPTLSHQSLSSRRRSTTPIPHYEPPAERFTPPREIIHTPPRNTRSPDKVTKSSKRKSTVPKSKKKLVLTIKKEPPEIDLSLPPPPASPSDDPLLLKGLPGPPRRRKSVLGSVVTATPLSSRKTPSIASSSASPPSNVRTEPLPELNSSRDISMQQEDDDEDDSFAGAPPAFDFTNVPEDTGAWTDDSDPEEFDQSGEFTGRFKVLTVPTKADPPSSCTRSRQEAWGNPYSPFPGPRRRSFPASSSPPLKAVADPEEDVEAGGSLDDEDVFFLDNTALDASREGLPGELYQQSYGAEEGDSTEDQQTAPETPPPSSSVLERSPSPVPVVDVESQEDSFSSSGHQVRFGEVYEDFSMELHGESSMEDAQVVDPSMSILENELEEDEDDNVDVEDAPDPHDSSDEETVDRELSRPLELDSDEEHEHHDTRPKPPTVPTPPRPAFTPARSLSPTSGPQARPRGFISITSPLRRHKSPDIQVVCDASSMPSIQAVFATPVNAQPPSESEAETSPAVPRSWEDVEIPADGPAVEETLVDEGYVATDAEDESGDESGDLDDGVVKITSDDPRVAARAAAILKMHDYNLVIKDPSRKRRHSSIDSALRKARRRSTMEGAVGKSSTPVNRRRTLGGIVGDKVFIPGSPLTTIPQLLQDAERSILQTPSRNGSFSLDASGTFKLPLPTPIDSPMFETPRPGARAWARPLFNVEGPRAWSKDDWKLLDSCFTDERLALGAHRGIGEAVLGPVEDVDLEKVVNRFLDQTGGIPVDECWPGWTRENLLRRAHALQKKQRSGKAAPPTPSGRFGSVTLSDVPDFTPLPSRQSSVQPGLERHGSMSSTSGRPVVPASLLAPRYSHLLDEAVAISRNEPGPSTPPNAYRSVSAPSPAAAARAESEVPGAGDYSMAMPPPPPPQSITSRMKGFFFSYLPRATKPSAVRKPKKPAHPGLPIPPPEVFAKPRGPISTPVSKPLERSAHPKELVNLNHAPPPKPSRIPRPAPPRRLVELHPAPAPPEPRPRSSMSVLSDRRSSSGSVRDLVKGFESLEKQQAQEVLDDSTRLRRVKSIGEWVVAAGPGAASRAQQSGKPAWK